MSAYSTQTIWLFWPKNAPKQPNFQPAERFSDVTGLCHHSVFGAKSAENGELRKVCFFVSGVKCGVRATKFAQPAPDVPRAPNSVFCPEKPANSSPLNSSPLVTASSPLAFWVQKCAKPAPVPELLSRRVFRGPTARRGPGSEPDSPPRWSVSPPSLSPLTSPLRPAPFLVQKALKTAKSKKFVFSCQTASGMPEPQVSLVFGRKQAPDAHFAHDSAFSPENRRIPSRRACNRLSPLRHRFVTGPKSAQKRFPGKFESIMEPGDSSMAHGWARLAHEWARLAHECLAGITAETSVHL